MDELVAWYRQQLDEAEKVAKAAERKAGMDWRRTGDGLYNESDPGRMPGPFLFDESTGEEVLDHIARHDPAAVLADIAAKRAVLLLCEAALVNASATSPSSFVRGQGDGYQEAMTEAVRYLARAYRHRPGWRQEWE